jgi:hypothetical protein
MRCFPLCIGMRGARSGRTERWLWTDAVPAGALRLLCESPNSKSSQNQMSQTLTKLAPKSKKARLLPHGRKTQFHRGGKNGDEEKDRGR